MRSAKKRWAIMSTGATVVMILCGLYLRWAAGTLNLMTGDVVKDRWIMIPYGLAIVMIPTFIVAMLMAAFGWLVLSILTIVETLRGVTRYPQDKRHVVGVGCDPFIETRRGDAGARWLGH